MRSFNLGHSEFLDWPMEKPPAGETLLVSPRPGNSHGYEPPTEEVLAEQYEEVRKVRSEVKARKWPRWFLEKYLGRADLPKRIADEFKVSEADPEGCARIVRMDRPADIWLRLLKPMAPPPKANHRGVPFVEHQLRDAEAALFIAQALDKGFDVKYFYGVCRPIEVFDPTYQQYETPNHPSWVAGHSVFAGAGCKFYEKQLGRRDTEAQYMTKFFGFLRSFSLMHTAADNIDGWRVGYEFEGPSK